jgi:hypothetical protein
MPIASKTSAHDCGSTEKSGFLSAAGAPFLKLSWRTGSIGARREKVPA